MKTNSAMVMPGATDPAAATGQAVKISSKRRPVTFGPKVIQRSQGFS